MWQPPALPMWRSGWGAAAVVTDAGFQRSVLPSPSGMERQVWCPIRYFRKKKNGVENLPTLLPISGLCVYVFISQCKSGSPVSPSWVEKNACAWMSEKDMLRDKGRRQSQTHYQHLQTWPPDCLGPSLNSLSICCVTWSKLIKLSVL